jgi:hypothetical protein
MRGAQPARVVFGDSIPLPIKRAVRYAWQMAEAHEAAHRLGVKALMAAMQSAG